MLGRLGRAFIMVDQSKSGSTSAEVRRSCQLEQAPSGLGGGDVWRKHRGQSRRDAGLMSAIRLLQPDTMPTVFTRTEEEARAWISSQRSRLPRPTEGQLSQSQRRGQG